MVSEYEKLEKICTSCQESLPIEEFGPHPTGKWGKNSQCRRCKKDLRFQRKFGVGLDWVENRLKQQKGRCAMCKMFLRVGERILDRERSTGLPRGVVCHRCATFIGLVDDRVEVVENMIKYLESYEDR